MRIRDSNDVMTYLIDALRHAICRGSDLLINGLVGNVRNALSTFPHVFRDLLWLGPERIRVPRLDGIESGICIAVCTSSDGCKTCLDRYGITPCCLCQSLGGRVGRCKVGVFGEGRMYGVK